MAGAGGGGGGVVRDVEALDGVRSIVLKPSESLDESRFTRIAAPTSTTRASGSRGCSPRLRTRGSRRPTSATPSTSSTRWYGAHYSVFFLVRTREGEFALGATVAT